ncbi:MAG: class I SAM-dependent methyltransferase [Proteobacteria bacterium]|nr:class I SAM-dependent methyltransferase [Pseudomonadota bacterium]
MTGDDSFTPALGKSEWTGLYDVAIAVMTREGRWRKALADQCAPGAGEKILDVGCGTGTLAVLLKRRAPKANLIGLDPDADILERARRKAAKSRVDVEFRQGFAHDAGAIGEASVDKVVSSLVFHQTPMEEKRLGISAIHRVLRPSGEFHLADYGLQRTPLMRRLFRQVQRLDGFENTEPNAQGVLPQLMREAGFIDVREARVIATPTGSISLYFARKAER